jgi:hypothetical protein
MLVDGVGRAQELHPNRTILLDGVDSSLFWSAMYDKPFRLVGAREVFLAPGAEKSIDAHPEVGEIAPFVMPRGVAAKALERDMAVVYRVEPDLLRNVTREFRRKAREWPREAPREVDAGLALFDDQIGEGWYARESGYRWMGRTAEIRIAGPPMPGMRLILNGFSPPGHGGGQPLRLAVSAAGIRIGEAVITPSQSNFELQFALPAELVGRAEIKVRLDLDRTVRAPKDPRELGLAFGTFSLR